MRNINTLEDALHVETIIFFFPFHLTYVVLLIREVPQITKKYETYWKDGFLSHLTYHESSKKGSYQIGHSLMTVT